MYLGLKKKKEDNLLLNTGPNTEFEFGRRYEPSEVYEGHECSG